MLRIPRSISELKSIKSPLKDTCYKNPTPWRSVSQVLRGYAFGFHFFIARLKSLRFSGHLISISLSS